MKTIVERHGGTVEKFIGDAVMAVFGVPVVHEDDALRAVRAGAEMRERLAELNRELERVWGVALEVRIGVNTGEAVAGDAAAAATIVTGDVVNTAKRLEEAAGRGGVLIGRETHRLVAGAVEAEAVEPLTLKGKSEPVAAWRVAEVDRAAAGVPRRLGGPFVGRAKELELLVGALARVEEERSCRLFTIL